MGRDLARLRRDVEAPAIEEHIANSVRLGQALGLNGTPSFVIGDALVPGLVEQEELHALVAEAREDTE